MNSLYLCTCCVCFIIIILNIDNKAVITHVCLFTKTGQTRKEVKILKNLSTSDSLLSLLGQGLQENSSEEEKQGSNLHSPCLAISTLKFTVNEYAKEGRDKKGSTAQSIADGEAQLTSSRSVTPVTESQKEGRPNSRPSLLPSSMNPVRVGALLTLQWVTHDNAKM